MTEPTFSLSDITQALDAKYKPVVIDLGADKTATLRPAGRLDDATQDKLFDKQGEFNDLIRHMRELQAQQNEIQETAKNGGDVSELPVIDMAEVKSMKAGAVKTIEELLVIVSATKADGDRLVKACNHDLEVLMGVFSRYQEQSQLGEASASSAT